MLCADGVDLAAVRAMQRALTEAGAVWKIIAPRQGSLKGHGGVIAADYSFLNAASVLFDAVFVPGGDRSVEALAGEASALLFVREAYKHCKAIAAVGAGVGLLSVAGLGDNGAPQDHGGTAATLGADEAIAVGTDAELPRVAARFVRAIGRHRNWDREAAAKRVPA
jgi:catalase